MDFLEEFTLKGESGRYINIAIQEAYGFPESTCQWGGYELSAFLEVKTGNYLFKSAFSASTGEVYEFFRRLEVCNKELKGVATFSNFERTLELTVTYTLFGQVSVRGNYAEHTNPENRLTFGFMTDQSYLALTLEGLRQIARKYGDMKGVKK